MTLEEGRGAINSYFARRNAPDSAGATTDQWRFGRDQWEDFGGCWFSLRWCCRQSLPSQDLPMM